MLPEYRYLIVDEAHHLEANVTNQLSFQADQRSVERILAELARPVGVRRYTGFLSEVLTRCRGVLPAAQWAVLEGHVQQLQRQTETALNHVYAFFNHLSEFLQEASPRSGDYDQRLRLTSGLRVQPAWSDIEIAWENLAGYIGPILDGLAQLSEGLSELEESGIAALEGTPRIAPATWPACGS